MDEGCILFSRFVILLVSVYVLVQVCFCSLFSAPVSCPLTPCHWSLISRLHHSGTQSSVLAAVSCIL